MLLGRGVVRRRRGLLRFFDAGRLQPQQGPVQTAPRECRAALKAQAHRALHPRRQRREQQMRARPGQAAGAIVQWQPRPRPVLLGCGLVRRRRGLLRVRRHAGRVQPRAPAVPRVPRPDPEERDRRAAGDVPEPGGGRAGLDGRRDAHQQRRRRLHVRAGHGDGGRLRLQGGGLQRSERAQVPRDNRVRHGQGHLADPRRAARRQGAGAGRLQRLHLQQPRLRLPLDLVLRDRLQRAARRHRAGRQDHRAPPVLQGHLDRGLRELRRAHRGDGWHRGHHRGVQEGGRRQGHRGQRAQGLEPRGRGGDQHVPQAAARHHLPGGHRD
mmetsp:Transcript_6469/g.15589  ORF Transcript_6469/g.15589 Transcript_6469/m.15589 type:complete len:325 (+) Transcript_6469:197-1171(+)